MKVFDNHIYLLENGTVFVYDTGNGKLVRRFGRSGEGPGETQNMPGRGNMIFVNPKGVTIDARNKVVLFSRRGRLLKEFRKPHEHFFVKPFQNRWITLIRFQGKKGGHLGITLSDRDFNILKRFGSQILINNQGAFDLIPDAFNFCVGNDGFFIEYSKEGFLIKKYSPEGSPVAQIKKNSSRQRVSPEDIQFVWHQAENDPEVRKRGGVTAFKKTAKYDIPKFIPPIKNITCDGGILHVKTFTRRDNTNLFYFYESSNLMGNTFLPSGVTDNLDDQLTGRLDRYYCFSGDFYYFLQEDQDTETWQVHRINWLNRITNR